MTSEKLLCSWITRLLDSDLGKYSYILDILFLFILLHLHICVTKSPVPRVLGLNTCNVTPTVYYGSTALEQNGVGFTLKQFNSKQLKLVHFANNYKETDKMTFLK